MKNYLTKIYKLPVMEIRSRIAAGKTVRDRTAGYVKKLDEEKIVYVTLPKDVKFTYPDVYPSDGEASKQRRDDEKALDSSKDMHKKFLERSSKRRGVPGWFTI